MPESKQQKIMRGSKHSKFQRVVSLSCFLSIGLFSGSSSALVSNGVPRTAASALSMSSFLEGGWDNDNFLDSLSRGNSETEQDNEIGNEAIDRANDEYFQQSKYGRPPMFEETASAPPPPPTTGRRLSYAESLKQKQQQRQDKLGQQQEKDDMSAVSDAAAEIYAYSYNKNVDAPPSPSVRTTSAIDVDATPVTQEASEDDIVKEEPLAKELVEKAKASHDDEAEEASQGGSRFRELMERAKEKAQEEPPRQVGGLELELQRMQEQVQQLQMEIQRLQQQQQAPQQQFQPPPVQQQQELQQQQLQMQQEQIQVQKQQLQQQQQIQNPLAAPADDSVITPSMIMTPEEVAGLSVEDQARLYREFFYVQQQKKKAPQQQAQKAPVSMGSTADTYLEAGIGFDGKKIGSNRDADAISNASDVYFAQLKRDSTTRNIARYSGDHTKANDVFHDPAIQDIKAPVNPYLEDQQKRMRDVLETVPEEMLVFQEYEDDEDKVSKEELTSYTGVSYKEKMEQKKREREERRKKGGH